MKLLALLLIALLMFVQNVHAVDIDVFDGGFALIESVDQPVNPEGVAVEQKEKKKKSRVPEIFAEKECPRPKCPVQMKQYQNPDAPVPSPSSCPKSYVKLVRRYLGLRKRKQIVLPEPEESYWIWEETRTPTPPAFLTCCPSYFQCQKNAVGFTWAQCSNEFFECATKKFYTYNRGVYDTERAKENFADLQNLIREDNAFSCPTFNSAQMSHVECRPYLPMGSKIKA